MLAKISLSSLLLASSALAGPANRRDATVTSPETTTVVTASPSGTINTTIFSTVFPTSSPGGTINTTIFSTVFPTSSPGGTINTTIYSTVFPTSSPGGTINTTIFSTVFPTSSPGGTINTTIYSTVYPTTTATATTTSIGPGPTGSVSCEALLSQCRVTNPSPNYSDLLYALPCVAAASCNPGKTNGVIQRLNPFAIRAVEQPRLSKTLFDFFSSDKQVWTQQNYIDFYYGALSKKEPQGPWPGSVLEVETQWSLITGWTGFCETNAVPYQNLADYFQFASTIAAGNPCPVAVPFPSTTVVTVPITSGVVSSVAATAVPSGVVTSVFATSYTAAPSTVTFSSGGNATSGLVSSSIVTVTATGATSVPASTGIVTATASSSEGATSVPASSGIVTATASSSGGATSVPASSGIVTATASSGEGATSVLAPSPTTTVTASSGPASASPITVAIAN